MSKSQKIKQIEEQETKITGNEIATVNAGALSNSGGFENIGDALLNEIAAGIEDTLKQISVTEFKGARGFVGKTLSLLDAFNFTMTEESQQEKGKMVDISKVMYVVADQESGEVSHVMQNLNASRERFIKLYAQVKLANATARTNKQLTLTNVEFREVGQARFGNKPIVLLFTPDTQQVWSDGNAAALSA
jgi:hypothetical protein